MHQVVKEDIGNITKSGRINWSRFNNKVVLVTGANGFLASYIVYALMSANELYKLNLKVIALCRNLNNAKEKFSDYDNNPSFKLVIHDVIEPLPEFGAINFIIHAASQASPKYYGIDPVGTSGANTIGNHQLLKLAKEGNIESYLYISSSEVYGIVTNDGPLTERDFGVIDISNVRACYSESKRMGEVMCVSWFHQYGVPTKIVRPFHTYGPGMQLNDGRVYADFVSNIVFKRDMVLNSNGTAKRAFCYSAEAVEAFLLVLLDGQNGEAYNVGNREAEISIIGLAEMLVNMYPELGLSVKKNFSVAEGYIPSVVRSNCPDISKIEKLGWKPVVGLQEGFGRTVKYYI